MPDTQKRFEALKQFVASDPNDSFSRYALALEHRSRGEHTEAITQLEELRRRDPQYLALYYALGGLYAVQHDTTSAKEVYLAGIAMAGAQNEQHTKSELEEAIEAL